MHTLYVGGFVHSTSLTTLETCPAAIICVSPSGSIEWIERDAPASTLQDVCTRHSLDPSTASIVECGPDEWFVPGMIDTHIHAPQFPNNGLGSTLQLLEWLDTLTFPEEQKYADPAYAKAVFSEVVKTTLAYGTTTCCYYSSSHLAASQILAQTCRDQGQRAFIGKCNMDRLAPSTYVESTSASIADTRTFLESFTTQTSLVRPILTPRFALSCTPDLLTALSTLSHSTSPPLPIQTHLAENPAEVQTALRLFPECTTYAGVYEKFGLLHDGTILAHCVHLTDAERDVIRRNNAGISHCPGSNLNLNSGCAEVRKMLNHGIKVGLGTDCSGGPSPSLLENLRLASHTSRFHAFSDPATAPLSLAELWYLATLGGASLCRLDDTVGNFEVGKEWDALRVGLKSRGVWQSPEPLDRRFERWIWGGDDRDIAEVYVQGTKVK